MMLQGVRYSVHCRGVGHWPASCHQADEPGTATQEGAHHQRDPGHERNQAT